MKETLSPEIVRNAFYLPEDELTEEEVDRVMVHGLLMSKNGGNKKDLVRTAIRFCTSDNP